MKRQKNSWKLWQEEEKYRIKSDGGVPYRPDELNQVWTDIIYNASVEMSQIKEAKRRK